MDDGLLDWNVIFVNTVPIDQARTEIQAPWKMLADHVDAGRFSQASGLLDSLLKGRENADDSIGVRVGLAVRAAATYSNLGQKAETSGALRQARNACGLSDKPASRILAEALDRTDRYLQDNPFSELPNSHIVEDRADNVEDWAEFTGDRVSARLLVGVLEMTDPQTMAARTDLPSKDGATFEGLG